MSAPITRRWVLTAGAGITVAAAVGATRLAAAATSSQAAAPAGSVTTGTMPPAGAPILDTVVLGDAASEQAHVVTATLSSTLTGGLAQPARRLSPTTPPGVWGGSIALRLRCDPQHPTYVTTKLWGDEFGDLGRLMLFCDGKQVGHYHLGPVDPIDIAGSAPRTPGRFFYHTLPLPEAMTRGRTDVVLEVRAMGRIYAYGSTSDQYYHAMTGPSRGIYRMYTHTDPSFVPPADERRGTRPTHPPTRTTPGREVIDAIATRVQTNVTRLLSGAAANYDQWQMLELALAYGMPSTPAYRNPKALDQVLAALDGLYLRYLANPKEITPDTPQQWAGLGRAGHTLALLGKELATRLTEPVSGATTAITRLAAYTKMLVDSRDYGRQHFRQYTNQAMINAFGIYLANRGLSVIAPESALPERAARDYVYQSVGLTPWLGPEDATGTPSKPLGDGYYQTTRKGLTRELSYVGNYGEVTDWLCLLYEAVTGHGGPSDSKLRRHLIKIVKARAAFRYPEVDDDGNRAMRLEAVIGCRDHDYPGVMTYAQRFNWEGHPLMAAVALKDSTITGYAQQMMADNQLYSEAVWLRDYRSTRGDLNALRFVADTTAFAALPASSRRLPMSDGQPDFVFTDEENGTVAIKRGDERLYLSLFWRSINAGVNNLARVHHITPTYSHSATIAQQTTFVPSGKTTAVPDWVNFAFGNGGIAPPGPKLHLANAGEVQPRAVTPYGPTPGVFSGRGDFYRCAYGRYLIGLNTTTGSTYELPTSGSGTALDLVTGKSVRLGDTVTVKPLHTVVLYLP